MILFGLILILLAAGAGVLLFMGTAALNDPVTVDMPIGTINLPPLALLITGAAVITLFWLGWALLSSGIRRGNRRRREAKQAARDAEARRIESEKRTQEEFAAKERELADERRRREEEATALNRQAQDQVAEQHLATETARQRAEVAERELRDRGDRRV